MGMLDIFSGAAAGGVLGYVGGLLQSNQKVNELKGDNKSLEKMAKELQERIGVIDPERQKQAIARIALLRQVAWKDDSITDTERLFIHDYILNSNDLATDKKVLAMQELKVKPAMQRQFFELFKKSYKRAELFGSQEEEIGFRTILVNLARCDKEVNPEEREYINQFLASFGLSAVE